MKKWLVALLLLMLCVVPNAIAEAGEEPLDEWTVMFYFCGSDLESRYSYATLNMEEITRCYLPRKFYPFEGSENEENCWLPDQVNVLIQTGGSKEWHAQRLGMNVATNKLQRWSYQFSRELTDESGYFQLEQELPLQSMAQKETLSDFIKWGAETCPAKKYALVLWDHGGGSKTGIFIDELFDGDVMSVRELGESLSDSGVHLETVLFDACMMANIETACAIADSASWMIASEEIVPGKGSDVDGWLQELINNPYNDGRRMGRFVCDMTQKKYASMDDTQARAILTWSVIDLSKVEKVEQGLELFFQKVNESYLDYPELLSMYATMLFEAEEYGMGKADMRDIFDIYYNELSVNVMETELRGGLLNALSDAVVYNVHGAGRSSASGLSFCYATSFTNEELEVYSDNCNIPSYLAFLDAISEWTAPDWVYDVVERLPELKTRSEFETKIEKCMSPNGIPGLYIERDGMGYLSLINYQLYRYDPETEQVVRLGSTLCRALGKDDGVFIWGAVAPWKWPSIDGQLCDIEMIFADDDTCLYNIPVKIGTKDWILRCGRSYNRHQTAQIIAENALNYSSSYTVYGVWEGYDDDDMMPGRNVQPLSQKAGQEFRLLYAVDTHDVSQSTMYQASDPMKLYRTMEVKEVPLPAGTYYLEYELFDMFLRPIELERIELNWDGNNFSFPENLNWEGTITLETYRED